MLTVYTSIHYLHYSTNNSPPASFPSFRSGSIFDLDEVNRTISSVVRIDRLPKHNSMEALLSLQDAWDHVDAYHHHATFYKILTKLSYALLLLASIATSIVAISRGNKLYIYQ